MSTLRSKGSKKSAPAKKSSAKKSSKNSAGKSTPEVPTNPAGTGSSDAQVVPPISADTSTASAKAPVKSKRTKKGALAARETTNKPQNDGVTTFNTQADVAMSRQPGSGVTTALGGPGPQSPTDGAGNFEGTPGEDIQAAPVKNPAEVRNATSPHRPEGNVSRSSLATKDHDNLDARAVPPSNIDKEAADRHTKAKKFAAEHYPIGKAK